MRTRLSQVDYKKIIHEIKEIGAETLIREFKLSKEFIVNIKKNRLNECDIEKIETLCNSEKYKNLYSLKRHVSDEDMQKLRSLVNNKGTQKEISQKIGKSATYINMLLKADKKNPRYHKYVEIYNKINNM